MKAFGIVVRSTKATLKDSLFFKGWSLGEILFSHISMAREAITAEEVTNSVFGKICGVCFRNGRDYRHEPCDPK